jgi:hypothetical protein
MSLPGFTAEYALAPRVGAYRIRARAQIGSRLIRPQEASCDIGYVEGREGLWVVCCDSAASPPCVATGLV